MCLLCVAMVFARCGGDPGGITEPSAPVTIGDVAPSVAETVASTVTAALRAGSTAAGAGAAGSIDRWLAWLPPVTLHAQTSAFVAPCPRAGNAEIRYFGSRSRVVLSGAQVVFAGCGFTFRQQQRSFSGTLIATGTWTATDPSPVRVDGTLSVDGVGPATLDGVIGSDATFNGTIGGTRIGNPDTPPPANPAPEACEPALSVTSIHAPAGGGTYPVAVTAGSTCAWTAAGADFVIVTPTTGTGSGTVTVTVPANGGAARTTTISIAGRSVTVSQAPAEAPPPAEPPPPPPPVESPPASGQENSIGWWDGEVTVSQPCAVGVPNANYAWTARITRKGTTYVMEWTDDYFDMVFERELPSTRGFTLTVSDGTDSFTLTGTFSENWRRVEGSLRADIDCVTSVVTAKGTWAGAWSEPLD
jgi:hypothetical protein